jgi:dTDP-glucose 4,6-dehydratase
LQSEPTKSTWLVTGGAGFIGSMFVRLVIAERPNVRIVNLDALTYAGNPANLASVEADPRYRFVHGNICDVSAVDAAIGNGVDAIVNFAAETHVDRSILAPEDFLHTDILGTCVLLEAVRRHGVPRYVQVSTDEVYGHVPSGESKETDPIAPRSPYAASKAGGDLQVLAYHTTYGTPVLVTRGSNTYGPYQYPEKLIPLFVTNLLDDQPVPVYGDGLQIRDWLHVEDHARGILHVLERGELGNAYNIGGGTPRTNLEITRRLLGACGRSFDTHVRHVLDRPGHDRRYALDSSKANALGWSPRRDFESGLLETVAWYRDNEPWWRAIKSGAFGDYYRRQYAERGAR